MYHMFFIHFSVGGYLGCFSFLVIVNSDAVNIGVHMSFWIMVFSGISSVVGLLSCVVVLFFSFLRKLHVVFHSGQQQYKRVS